MEEQSTKTQSSVFVKLGNDISAIDLDKLLPKYYTFEKQDIIDAINNGDITKQRQMSAYFYRASGVYRQLCHRIAGVHRYRNFVTPVYYLSKSNKFNEKIDKEVMKYYKACKVDNASYNIGLQSIVFGSCYLYENQTSEGNIIQQVLPPDRCRTRSKDEYENNTVEFDFSYFDSIINAYKSDEVKDIWKTLPKEFEKLYKNYRSNKSNCGDSKNPKWQMLDTNYARCYSATLDGSPLFVNMFVDILDATDYKSVDIERAKQKLFKLIVQKFELKEDGEPKASDDEIKQSNRNLVKAVDNSAACLTTAFDVESVSLDSNGSSASSEIKFQELAQESQYNSAGVPQQVFGNSGNAGANAIKTNNDLTASIFEYLIKQEENWYNKKINLISKGKVVYEFRYLPINIFNEKDMIGYYKQFLDLGSSAIVYSSAIGIPQYTLDGLLEYENNIGLKDKFKVLINSNQASAQDIESGSNKKDDNDKADTTIEKDDIRS